MIVFLNITMAMFEFSLSCTLGTQSKALVSVLLF